MHWEGRLWKFTEAAVADRCGGGRWPDWRFIRAARLAILGWLIYRIFAGDGFDELLVPMIAAAVDVCPVRV